MGGGGGRGRSSRELAKHAGTDTVSAGTVAGWPAHVGHYVLEGGRGGVPRRRRWLVPDTSLAFSTH